jgi:hypothetical protein
MGDHNIDLVHGIDPAQGTSARDVDRNQTAVRATRGV